MASVRIQRLDVEGFRGIIQPRTLLFEGKSLVLFGENGTGKSSFIDALERLLTGEVSTLDGRAQGLSSDRHGPHIKLTSGSPQIALTLDDAESTAITLQTAVPESGSVQSYLQAARQPVYILRRGQILNFIESIPSERYQLLRPFFPLSGIEEIENCFGQASARLEEESAQAHEEVNKCSQELARLLGIFLANKVLSEEDVVSGLSKKLGETGYPPLRQLTEIPALAKDLDNALSQFGDLSKHSALSEALTATEELRKALVALSAEPAATVLTELRQREAREARVFYEKVLEEGSRWIEDENRTECPLCEQEMRRYSPKEVVSRARKRLEEMRELLVLRQRARESCQATLRSVQSCIEGTERAGARLAKLREGIRRDVDTAIKQAKEALADLTTVLRRPLPEINSEALAALTQRFRPDTDLIQSINNNSALLRKELEALPSAQAAQNLLHLRDLLIRSVATWEELSELRIAAAKSTFVMDAARIAHQTVQEARKETIGRLYEEISRDVDEIYSKLHYYHEPRDGKEPGHRNVRLEVREAVQKSVNIRADFYDQQEVDPRAYYSDAHLDTLGISIFLALRRWYRRQHPGFDLIVLDDVLTSVDTAHAVQLAEVLLTDFADFQVFLTTHDRIWFEHLRDIEARCGVAQNFVNKVIHKWTLDDGPDIREPEDERSQLERLLTEGQSYEIASMAGRLLEHILQEMRYAFRLRVPAKPGEVYEIGDLWPAFNKEIKKNYTGLYSQGEHVFEILDVNWPLRNWVGSHFNTWAKNVSRENAVRFGRAVAGLFDLVFCSQCRRFVIPSATPLGQIACRCGNKIYPAPGKQASRIAGRKELVAETAGALKDAKLNSSLYLVWKRAERSREQ